MLDLITLLRCIQNLVKSNLGNWTPAVQRSFPIWDSLVQPSPVLNALRINKALDMFFQTFKTLISNHLRLTD